MASRSQTLARIATGKTVADRTEWIRSGAAHGGCTIAIWII
jgi:hypothetical protein